MQMNKEALVQHRPTVVSHDVRVDIPLINIIMKTKRGGKVQKAVACYEHYFWQIQLWKVRKVDPTFLLHRPSALQSGIDAGCQTSSYIGNKERAPKFSLGRLRFQWTRHTFWMKVALWFNHSKWFTRPVFSSILSISISFFANVHRRSVIWQAEQKSCLPTLEQMDDWKKLSWINTLLISLSTSDVAIWWFISNKSHEEIAKEIDIGKLALTYLLR